MRLRALRPRPSSPPADPGGAPIRPTPPWRRMLRPPTNRELRDALRRNPGLKLLSLLLAVFLWFSINVSDPGAEGTLEVPVRIEHLASDLIVTSQPTKPVSITLRGPRTILDGVNERRTRISLDFSVATPGESRVELNADMIRPELPQRLKVVRIEPARAKLVIERLARKRLPVRPELAGQAALGYTVAEARATPAEVEVSGPVSKVKELTEIRTEPVYLRRAAERFEKSALLSWAGDFVTFVPDHVTVTVTLQQQMMSRVFENVEITVRNAPGGLPVQLTPRGVELTLSGPQRLLTSFTLPDGSVFVDAAGLAPGTHRVAPQVELPQGLEVTGRQPDVFTLQVGGGKAAR